MADLGSMCLFLVRSDNALNYVLIQGTAGVATGSKRKRRATQRDLDDAATRSLMARHRSPISRMNKEDLNRSLYSMRTLLNRRQILNSYLSYVADVNPEVRDTPFESTGLVGR